MNDLECPYCDAELKVNHDDGFGYAEDESHEMECDKCEKSFTFQTHINFSYHPSKADCLNTGHHIFSEWKQLWEHEGISTQDRECETCGKYERRNLPLSTK